MVPVEATMEDHVLFRVGPGECRPMLGSMGRVVGQVCGNKEGGTLKLSEKRGGDKIRLNKRDEFTVDEVTYRGV